METRVEPLPGWVADEYCAHNWAWTKGDWAVRLDYTTDAFRVYRLDQHVGRLIHNTVLANQSIWVPVTEAPVLDDPVALMAWVEVAGWTNEK